MQLRQSKVVAVHPVQVMIETTETAVMAVEVDSLLSHCYQHSWHHHFLYPIMVNNEE